jgi:hypothetical protein
MPRYFGRLTLGACSVVAAAALTVAPVSAATTIGTSTSAKASSQHVSAGDTFSISGKVKHGSLGLAGQTVFLFERTGSTPRWTKASTVGLPSALTSATGAYTFVGVVALKKGEQFRVVHPAQTVDGKTYGRSVSRIITVTR